MNCRLFTLLFTKTSKKGYIMSNKYVDFVSDKDFLMAVKKVVDAYPSNNNVSTVEVLTKSKNTIDEIKTVFDISVNKIGFEEWARNEISRQSDKTINNKIGEFHQEILGKVDGWIDLGVGDETEVDLKKEDNSVFIELKNKYNTMNSSSKETCRRKLEDILKIYPDATVYWAYIIERDYKSVDTVWEYQGRRDERVRKISGEKVYELVTGDPKALKSVFEAIPIAIEDILGEEYALTYNTMDSLNKYKSFVFK